MLHVDQHPRCLQVGEDEVAGGGAAVAASYREPAGPLSDSEHIQNVCIILCSGKILSHTIKHLYVLTHLL